MFYAGNPLDLEVTQESPFVYKVEVFETAPSGKREFITKFEASGFYSQVIEACDKLSKREIKIVYKEINNNHNIILNFPI